jgi:hypothetical protein
MDRQLIKKSKHTGIASLSRSEVGVRRLKDFVANSALLSSLVEWKTYQIKTKFLCWLIFITSCLLLTLIIYNTLNAINSLAPGRLHPFKDFLPLWSYQEIARTHPVAELYNMATTYQRQIALGMKPDPENPFPYPPSFLLFIWPLGLISYNLSYLFWVWGTLSVFIFSIFKTCSRLPFALGCAVVAPSCISNIWFGQSGFLTGALLIAGIRLSATQPIASGILLGLLSFKPQLGLLAPVALAAAGLWRTFAVACATVTGLVIIAAIAFGPDAWVAWISGLPEYAEWFQRPSPGMVFKISVTDNLRMFGVGSATIIAAQALATTAVAFLTWVSFRRGSTRLAHAALLTGAILASPHTLFYDTPMVVASMILFIQVRIETSCRFNLFEILILVSAFVSPGLLMFTNTPFPEVTLVSFILLFIVIIKNDLYLKYK